MSVNRDDTGVSTGVVLGIILALIIAVLVLMYFVGPAFGGSNNGANPNGNGNSAPTINITNNQPGSNITVPGGAKPSGGNQSGAHTP